MGRYDEIFDSEQEEWNGWGLSQSMACERKLCFKDCKKYAGKPINANTKRMFELGDAAEYVMKVRHPKMQLTMQQFKIRIEDRGGRIDGVIVDPAIEDALIWENKSMSFRAYSNYVKGIKGGKTLKELKQQYYAQIQCYLFAVQQMGVCFFDKVITKGLFTVVQRDMGLLNVIVVPYNHKYVEQTVIPRIKKVNDAKAKKHILPVPNYLESWECKYCDYSSTCKKLGKGTVTY